MADSTQLELDCKERILWIFGSLLIKLWLNAIMANQQLKMENNAKTPGL
jgi:hypothetical protein